MPLKEYKNRLHLLRKARGLNQGAVCEKIGITTKTLYNFERGIRPIPSDKLIKFAIFYKCSTDYILCFDNEKE